MAVSLREQVRAQQYDLYILSLFFPSDLRPAAWTILAFYAEIMAVADKVTEPLAGAMRLAWWRERITDIYNGKPVPQHPVLQALVEVIAHHALPASLWQDMIDAAGRRIEREPCMDEVACEQIAAQLTYPLYEALARLEGATAEELAALHPLSVADGMRKFIEELIRHGEVADPMQDVYIAMLARMDELLSNSHKKISEKRIINTIRVYIKLCQTLFTRKIKSRNFNAFSVDKAATKGLLPLRLAWALLLTK